MSKEVFEQELPDAFRVNLSDVFNVKEDEGLINEEVQETIPNQEEVVEESVAEDPYADYSDFAKIALLEAEEGFFNIDKKEIPKDIDALGLKELYKKNIEAEIELEKQRFFEQAGEAAEYLKILLEGGDPNDIQGMLKTSEILNIDISDVENQKLVIKSHLIDLGVPQADIDELVESTLDKGNGKARAEQALDFYRKAHDELLETNKQAIAEQAKKEQEYRQKLTSDVKAVIDSGVIGGYEIDKKKQAELYDAIFKPTEKYEYVDQYGRQQIARVPKIQVLAEKIKSDIPTYTSFALWLLEGGNFNFAKAQGESKNADNLRQLLEGKKSIKTETKTEYTRPAKKPFEWPAN